MSIGPVGPRLSSPLPTTSEPLPEPHHHHDHKKLHAPRRSTSKRRLKPGELEPGASGVDGIEGDVEDLAFDADRDDDQIRGDHAAEDLRQAARQRGDQKESELRGGLDRLDFTARVPHAVSEIPAAGSPAIGSAKATSDAARSAEVAERQAYYESLKSPPIARADYAAATRKQADVKPPELIRDFIAAYVKFSAVRQYGSGKIIVDATIPGLDMSKRLG